MKRRTFVQSLGLGAGATLFAPSLTRWVAEARGEEGAGQPFLMVLTDGNGWGHQGSGRNAETLTTTVRSETDWDLPAPLSAFAPFASRVNIIRQLNNKGDTNLHGNGWATLSGTGGDGHTPGGVSLDRLVALETGSNDAFSSLALGISTRVGRPPVCVSADGPRKPFPAIGSPFQAHQAMFGAGQGQDSLSVERSVLDDMIQDVKKIQTNLGGQERARFDQMLTSYRELEQRLLKRQAALKKGTAPSSPDPDIGAGLNRAVVESHIDLIAAAFTFGLTHVAHLSLLGMNAHNAGWGFLGFGGDAHESLAHVSHGYTGERATEAYHAVIDFKASMLARLYDTLGQTKVGDRTLAEQSVFVWVNSGGGKHHHGSSYHAMVTVGDAGGALQTGKYLDLPFRKHTVNQGFLAVAQGMGVKLDHFGSKELCPEPLPGLI